MENREENLRNSTLYILPDLALINIVNTLSIPDHINFYKSCHRFHEVCKPSFLRLQGDDFEEHGPDSDESFQPEIYFEGPKLKRGVNSMKMALRWKDQGWGNRKGEVYVQLVRDVPEDQLRGTYNLKSSGEAARKYPKLMGIYEKSSEIFNKFHVYKQVGGKGTAYVDSTGHWVVGTQLGKLSYTAIRDNTTLLSNINPAFEDGKETPPFTSWTYLQNNLVNKKWVMDESLMMDPTDSELNADGTKSVQEYSCDMFGYVKDFSLALTQANRANRIMKKPEKMDEMARTDFEDAVTALEAATQGGQACSGSPSNFTNFMSRLIYVHLQACKNDVPKICDKTKINNYTASEIQKATRCRPRLMEFAQQYRGSFFSANVSKVPPYEEVCPNLGISWNKPLNPGSHKDPDNSGGDIIKSPNTPLQLWRDECLPKTFKPLNDDVVRKFDTCKDVPGIVPGSHGSCMTYVQYAVLYVDLCNPFPSNFSILAAFSTWTYSQQMLLADVSNKTADLCLHTYGGSYTCNLLQNGTDKINATSVSTNFAEIASELGESTANGTSCHDSSINETVKSIYSILTNCSVSVPDICDVSPFLTKWTDYDGSQCLNLLNEFIPEYENSVDIQGRIEQVDPRDEIKSYISGYNLQLLANCIPDFCLSAVGCALVKNKLLTTISSLNTQFSICFEFLATEAPSKEMDQNIIHLAKKNDEQFLYLNVLKSGNLYACIQSNCNEIKKITITPGQWIQVEISQTRENNTYLFRVKINGVPKVELENGDPEALSNVKVYTADNFNATLDGNLRNLFINSYGSNINQCQGLYERTEFNKICSLPWMPITNQETCKDAAVALNLDYGGSFDRPGKFAGCQYSKDGDVVTFIQSPNPSSSPNADTAAICQAAVFETAKSSSTLFGDEKNFGPQLAIDGIESEESTNSFHSDFGDNYPWLEIELLDITEVSSMKVFVRKFCCGDSFKDVIVRAGLTAVPEGTSNQLLNNDNDICRPKANGSSYEGPAKKREVVNIDCMEPIKAKYITIQLNYTGGQLQIDEFQLNNKKPVKNNWVYLTEQMHTLKEKDCLHQKFNDLQNELKEKVATCTDANVVGSHESCNKAANDARPYIGYCKNSTTPGSSATSRIQQRRFRFNKKLSVLGK